MALSAFDDQSAPPDARTLATALGRTSGLWKRLIADLQGRHGPLVEEWNFSGKAYGWSLRLKQPTRVFVYLTPCESHFLASFVLGGKAYEATQTADLPASIQALIEQAPKYAEGRGMRIPVRSAADADAVRTLAAIKFAH
jgi:hypothetical protein